MAGASIAYTAMVWSRFAADIERAKRLIKYVPATKAIRVPYVTAVETVDLQIGRAHV